MESTEGTYLPTCLVVLNISLKDCHSFIIWLLVTYVLKHKAMLLYYKFRKYLLEWNEIEISVLAIRSYKKYKNSCQEPILKNQRTVLKLLRADLDGCSLRL